MAEADHADEHNAVEAADDLDVELTQEQEAEFRGYFVIQTPATARRFLAAVAHVLGRFDAEGLERIAENWELDPKPEAGPPYDEPTVILTGRRDSFVGFRAQWRLVEHYRRATYVTLDRAGHALPHERPEILDALLGAWLDDVASSRSA